MDPRTGRMYELTGQEDLGEAAARLVRLTDEQAKVLRPLSRRQRKRMLKGWTCFCGSGKSFKKCCWKKYKRRHKK